MSQRRTTVGHGLLRTPLSDVLQVGAGGSGGARRRSGSPSCGSRSFTTRPCRCVGRGLVLLLGGLPGPLGFVGCPRSRSDLDLDQNPVPHASRRGRRRRCPRDQGVPLGQGPDRLLAGLGRAPCRRRRVAAAVPAGGCLRRPLSLDLTAQVGHVLQEVGVLVPRQDDDVVREGCSSLAVSSPKRAQADAHAWSPYTTVMPRPGRRRRVDGERG